MARLQTFSIQPPIMHLPPSASQTPKEWGFFHSKPKENSTSYKLCHQMFWISLFPHQ